MFAFAQKEDMQVALDSQKQEMRAAIDALQLPPEPPPETRQLETIEFDDDDVPPSPPPLPGDDDDFPPPPPLAGSGLPRGHPWPIVTRNRS